MSRFHGASPIAPTLAVRPTSVGPALEGMIEKEPVRMAPHLLRNRNLNDTRRGYTIDYKGNEIPLRTPENSGTE